MDTDSNDVTAPVSLDAYLGKLSGDLSKRTPCKLPFWDAAKPISEADVLLLSCIDYRYSHAIHELMRKHFGLRYDQVSLAGAGLSAVIDFGTDLKPHWQQTVLEHVALSIQLHGIKTVLIMDHRNCGAYSKFAGLPARDYDHEKPDQARENDKKEYKSHKKHVVRLASILEKRFDDLEVTGILLSRFPKHPTGSEPIVFDFLYGDLK